uniref:Uncharacterized protein n=1 Tax=Fagus sylvatica TaxID=28930 RepID=A0A2N9HMG4_FAGSY
MTRRLRVKGKSYFESEVGTFGKLFALETSKTTQPDDGICGIDLGSFNEKQDAPPGFNVRNDPIEVNDDDDDEEEEEEEVEEVKENVDEDEG